MTEPEKHKILISMGYRKMRQMIYGKPMGNGMFLVDTLDMIVKYVFKDMQGKISTWSSQPLNENELLQSLKVGEISCFHTLYECNQGEFHFHTFEESLDMEL
jgi:hypothetical protein